METPQDLIAHARLLLSRAHAPYSKFPVAAIVIDDSGRMHGGVNIENASYGLTVCAERVAIFSAIAAGARRLTALAVTAQGLKPVAPCGACRQVIAEFFDPESEIHSDMADGSVVTWTMGELLPHAFTTQAILSASSSSLEF